MHGQVVSTSTQIKSSAAKLEGQLSNSKGPTNSLHCTRRDSGMQRRRRREIKMMMSDEREQKRDFDHLVFFGNSETHAVW